MSYHRGERVEVLIKDRWRSGTVEGAHPSTWISLILVRLDEGGTAAIGSPNSIRSRGSV